MRTLLLRIFLPAFCLAALLSTHARAQVAERWVAITSLSAAAPADAITTMNDVRVDAAGNVYVTGWTRNAEPVRWLDIATVKYDPAGHIIWSRTYNGPINYDDQGKFLRVDAAGNVYILGDSQARIVTLKYDPDGNLLWVDHYEGGVGGSDARRIELSPDGAIYVLAGYKIVSSHPTDAFLVIRYTPDGTREWERISDEAGAPYWEDSPAMIAVDADANVYVTGTTNHGIPTYADVRTLKYGSKGQLRWNVSYDDAHGFDTAKSIAVSPDGKVYVAAQNPQQSYLYVIQYDAQTRNQNWVRTYDAGFSEDIQSMTLDVSSSAAVTGSAIIGTTVDAFTVLFDPSGAVQWFTRLNGPALASDDRPAQVVTDADGNFYMTAASGPGMLPYDYNIVTVKYSPSGEEQWKATFDRQNDAPARIALDGAGNVYVTGQTSDFSTMNIPVAAVTIKYGQEAPTGVPDGHLTDAVVRLGTGRPNPFSVSTVVGFSLAEPGPAKIEIFDVAGRRVTTLLDRVHSAYTGQVTWDGRNDEGLLVSSGIYLVRLSQGRHSDTRKLVLLR